MKGRNLKTPPSATSVIFPDKLEEAKPRVPSILRPQIADVAR